MTGKPNTGRRRAQRKLRTRKCRNCRVWYKPKRTTQCVCSADCAFEKTKADKAKIRAREHKQRLHALKPLSQIIQEAQAAVNGFVRARDKDLGCISCGKPVTEAGHYFHAGTKYQLSRLRLDPRNIHGQCTHCNRFKGGGNQHEYRKGLIIRYGERALTEIESLKRQADLGQEAPLTREEIMQIRDFFRKEMRAAQN